MNLNKIARELGFDYLEKVPKQYLGYDVYYPELFDKTKVLVIGLPRVVFVQIGKYKIVYGGDPEGEKVWYFVNSCFPDENETDE